MNNYKTKDNIKIAISGLSGCGNTTVSNMLADELGIPCINYTFRSLAREMNISLKELMEKTKTDFKYDKAVDTRQIELASKTSCVLGSRLAIWILLNADLRVFLKASAKTRAARIHGREGGNIKEIEKFTEMRDSEDSRRYKELYGIDNSNFGFADLIIDTEELSPKEICDIIITVLTKKKLIQKNG
ncbi:MAG: cytidylate kinase [Treponema sp.]|nr:MAG: cytidylate kinase [Treponema sp.]